MIHQQRQRQRQNWIPISPPRNQPYTDYTPRHRATQPLEEISWNLLGNRRAISQASYSPTSEILLDAYDLETIDPRETWEQEQLFEFEGFVVLEHLQLLTDEIEQQDNIDGEDRLAEAREEEQNERELLQLEHCDHIDFLLLQLNQPLSYD
jgi:hypothetical protein